MTPSSTRIANRHLMASARVRTAGEVIFKKDRGGDKNEWAWNAHAPSSREMDETFVFKPKELRPLILCLRSTLAALGHVNSAHTTFLKIKSAKVSPDGNLGGRGYIAKITDVRRAYMNVSEALSSLSDTLYDEINAPHWAPSPATDAREQGDLAELVEDVEDIKANPESWANGEEKEMDDEHGSGKGQSKQAKAKEPPPLTRDFSLPRHMRPAGDAPEPDPSVVASKYLAQRIS